MNDKLSSLLNSSILLELNVGRLYRLFHNTFPEHKKFWWQLHLEEENHASLIRAIKEHFEPIGKAPDDLLSSNLQKLQDSNATIISLIDRYTETAPSAEEAFNVALKLELTAGEIHYQDFMDKDQSSILNKIFQKLNQDDKNHVARLCAYMEHTNIAIDDELKECC